MTAVDTARTSLVIDVWSDIMCPFCYLGDTHLAHAVAGSPHGDQITVRYHSFQLMPELPTDGSLGLYELLERERGFPRDQAEAMNAQIAASGAQVGLDYRFDRAIATNTHTAHRLTHFADRHGRQHDMVTRLFRAYFTDGLDIGNADVLAGLAAEVGLDRAAALDAITSGAYAAEVGADIASARRLGVSGVPFFVLDNRYAVSGAQPVDAFRDAIGTAWSTAPDQ